MAEGAETDELEPYLNVGDSPFDWLLGKLTVELGVVHMKESVN